MPAKRSVTLPSCSSRAGLQRGPVDARAVDVDAVGAAQVLDEEVSLEEDQPRVVLRDRRLGQHEVAVLAASERVVALLEEEDLLGQISPLDLQRRHRQRRAAGGAAIGVVGALLPAFLDTSCAAE
jgi:hypothetical protein